jgi:uncharacterized protein (TIGR03435 family)
MVCAWVACAREANAQTASPPKAFALSTVKPSVAQGWRLQPTPNGYSAMGVTLLQLVQEAYGMYEAGRVSGGPKWVDADKFDVEAKVDAEDEAAYREKTLTEKHVFLKKLLVERFGLVVREEVKDWPVYMMVVAKYGPKMKLAVADDLPEGHDKGITGRVTRSQRGLLEGRGFSMEGLAQSLSHNPDVGRIVVDRTGLTGRYNLALNWMPVSAGNGDDAGPSIFTAVQGQLGLKLEPGRSPVAVVVIERAEKPSAN